MSPQRGVIEKVRTKGLKYSAVSVVNVIVGQGLLLFFTLVVFKTNDPTMSETLKTELVTLSNVLAVCISAVPAYYLSRAWVWGRRGKSHFRTEVLPFWIFIVVGLLFSTLVVNLSSKVALAVSPTLFPPGSTRLLLVPNVANMVAFGILWVLRFFLFDKLFHVEQDAPPEDDELDEELTPLSPTA